jgi:hypothetical protein
MASKYDERALTELELYIDNDASLYRRRGEPILKNLSKKWMQGKYEHPKAVKLFMYLADDGAKQYAKEYASPSEWNKIFSVATRKSYAERAARHFETEALLGNIHHSVLMGQRKRVRG